MRKIFSPLSLAIASIFLSALQIVSAQSGILKETVRDANTNSLPDASVHDKPSADITNVTKVTFWSPGTSYEKRIGNFQSLYARASINTAFTFSVSDANGNKESVFIEPALALQYRYYYNFSRRAENGKRTEMNSLNYISPIFEALFTKLNSSSSYLIEKNRRAIKTFGFVWGFQRNLPGRFSLDYNIGVGLFYGKATAINETGELITKTDRSFTGTGRLTLGFWLNKKH